MEAYLTLLPRVGVGTDIDADRINAELAEAGVVHGMDPDAVLQALDAQREDASTDRLVVVRGTAPVDGDGGRIEYRVAVATGQRSTVCADGSVDHKQQDLYTTVKAGEVIAEPYPPAVQPVAGTNVLGETVAARDAAPLQIEAGQNVQQNESQGDDTVTFVATKAGKLDTEGNTLSVEEILIVADDVGTGSGNVRFVGAVQIKDSVQPGYSVLSDADVDISGVVDRALVSSGASIMVGQGVIGGGKAVLRARSEIHAQFAEQALLMSVGAVRLRSSCLRCSVKSNGKVLLDPSKGDFVGGDVRAREGMVVRNLGSERGVRTEVSFGQNYLVADRIEKEEAELARLKERSQEVASAITRAERAGVRSAERDELHTEKVRLLKAIEAKSFRLFTLRESLEEHTPSEIVVSGTVFPGVVFESHGRYYDIKTEKQRVIIRFNEKLGQIEERPLTERGESDDTPTDAQVAAEAAEVATAEAAEVATAEERAE